MSNLNEKLETAVNEFKEIEQRLTQVANAKLELEKALEQTRGKVATYQELIQEESAQDAEVVDGEPVVEEVPDKK